MSREKDIKAALEQVEELQDEIAFYMVSGITPEVETFLDPMATKLARVQNLLDRSYSEGFDEYDLAEQLELDFD